MRVVGETNTEAGAKEPQLSHSCSWDKAAGLLLDSEIETVEEHSAWQVFGVIHPRLGKLDILLCTVSDAVVTLKPAHTLDRLGRLESVRALRLVA